MRRIVFGLIIAISTASSVAAQSDDARMQSLASARDVATPDPEQPTRRRFQIGVGIKSTATPGPGSSSSLLPELVWRWRGKAPETSAHFKPAFRMGAFSSEIAHGFAGATLPVGDVHVRPFMVGVDYKLPRGRWEWSIGMAAGWAVNGVDVGPDHAARAASVLGTTDLWVDIHNSVAWGPRLQAIYDVNDRVSFIMNTSYVSTRPRLDVRADGRFSTTRLNADALMLTFGVVYAIY